MKKILSVLCLGIAFVLLQTCVVFETLSSVSESSESASESMESLSKSIKSISSSINSSSGSSSGDDDEKTEAELRYRNDISELTVMYVQHHSARANFSTDLRHVARQYGITDWEATPSTYIAIGHGLRKAGVESSDLKKSLSNIQTSAWLWIQKGYHS